MKKRDLIELLEVADCWSQGDLAGAVNDLEHAAKVTLKVVATYRRKLNKIRKAKGGAA